MEKQCCTPKSKKHNSINNSYSPCSKNPLMPINPNLFFKENIEMNCSKSPSFHKIKIKQKLIWTEEEDNNIRKFVDEFGTKKWKTLSEIYPGKTPKQYREHYYNCLKSNVLKKIDFTKAEDDIIMNFVKNNGRKFAKLSRLMPGRTETSIKNRFYFLSKHNLTQEDCRSEIEQNAENKATIIDDQNFEDDDTIKDIESSLNFEIDVNQFEKDLQSLFDFDPFSNNFDDK